MKTIEKLSSMKFSKLSLEQMASIKGGSWRYVPGSGTCSGGNTSYQTQHYNIWGNPVSPPEYATETDRTSYTPAN
jgi:natural product precursor